MKEVKVVVRDLRKEISENLMKIYEKEFFELKMKEIKQEKIEAEENFLFTYEKEPKMPKKEILRKKIGNGRNCKTVTKYQCEICQKYFTGKQGLKLHFKLHFKVPTLRQSFHCQKCDKKFANQQNHKVHICVSSTCPHCNVKFKTKAYAKTHLRLAHGIKIDADKFLCDYCGRGFNGIKYLKSHFKTGNCRKLKEPYSCDQCNKTFAYKPELRSHVLNHSKHEIECKICHTKMRLTSFKTHMWLFHSKADDNLQCKICLKKLKSYAVLKRHLKSHDKKFKCLKCAMKFSTHGWLNFHMKIHENPEQFQCEVCRKNLKSDSALKHHMKLHDKERIKNLKCNRCDYKTDLMPSLKRHLKFHERLDKKLKENPNAIQCEKCPAVVTSLSNYRTHMSFKHKNGTKFQCDLCQHSTIYKRELLMHLTRKHFKSL